jgi:vacuolar-type H+-ATPase subunit E/Vma4
MSINKLISALEKEAADKEEALLAGARSEASINISNAKKIVSDIDLRIATITKESDERKKLIRSGKTTIEKRNLSAYIENRCIAEIFSRCRELYRGFMKKKEYSDMVKSDLAKIKTELEEIGEIRADPVTAGILKKLKVREKVVADENSDYGFTAVTPGGEITVASTFERSLEKLWCEVAPEFVRKIGDVINDKY